MHETRLTDEDQRTIDALTPRPCRDCGRDIPLGRAAAYAGSTWLCPDCDQPMCRCGEPAACPCPGQSCPCAPACGHDCECGCECAQGYEDGIDDCPKKFTGPNAAGHLACSGARCPHCDDWLVLECQQQEGSYRDS